ncbi:hypothetical protein TNCV_4374701 [Trichonephila clavipes]|nr:hypothetical protein TNCV_4374701 [Trichonephila clavipes]
MESFFKNDEGHNLTVNGDRYRAMINNFFIPELNNHDVQELWFQQEASTYHIAVPHRYLNGAITPGDYPPLTFGMCECSKIRRFNRQTRVCKVTRSLVHVNKATNA